MLLLVRNRVKDFDAWSAVYRSYPGGAGARRWSRSPLFACSPAQLSPAWMRSIIVSAFELSGLSLSERW